jgi:hypothetical protein
MAQTGTGKKKKPKLVQIVLKNSASTSPRFTVSAVNLMTQFKKIIPVYAETRTKPTNKNAASLIGKVDGIYSYISALKG